MRSFTIIIILFFTLNQNIFASKGNSQFDLIGGLGYADDNNSENFPTSYTLIKFQGISGVYWNFLRWVTSFNAISGSNKTMAGEFSLGTAIYPLIPFQKLPTQPFAGASGVIATATIDGTSKMLSGYSIFSGIDLMMGKRFGLKFQVDYGTISYSFFRYSGGIIIYFSGK